MSITAGVAGGSIFAGLFGEPYDIKDKHSRVGVCLVLGVALAIILLIDDTLQGLVLSQVVLSIALPVPMLALIHFIGSRKVMGDFVSRPMTRLAATAGAVLVLCLNFILLAAFFGLPIPFLDA